MAARSRRTRLLVASMLVVAALAGAAPVATAAPGPQAACEEYSVCGGPTGAGTGAGHPSPPPITHPIDSIRLPIVGYPLTPASLALLVALAAALALGAALARRRSGRVPSPSA
jgi:hypothetical protein